MSQSLSRMSSRETQNNELSNTRDGRLPGNKKKNVSGQDSANATATYSGSAMIPQGSLSSTKNSLRYNYDLNPIAPLVGSTNGSQMENKYAFAPVSHYQTSQFSYQDPADCNG